MCNIPIVVVVPILIAVGFWAVAIDNIRLDGGFKKANRNTKIIYAAILLFPFIFVGISVYSLMYPVDGIPYCWF